MAQSNAKTKPSTSAILESFTSSAETYERRIGRATRVIAAHIVRKTLNGLHKSPVVHDNACGTGTLTDELLKVYPKAHIEATDVAAPMVDILDAQMKSRDLSSQVKGSIMDAASLGFDNDKFDASVTNFGIFFPSDPTKGMKEIHRTLKPGGIAALTRWENMDLIFKIFVGIEKLIKPVTELTRPDFLLK